MYRLPDSNVAITHMEEFLASKNIKIKHAYILELLAISRGFNNYNVMKSQEKNSQDENLLKALPVQKTVLEPIIDSGLEKKSSSVSETYQYYLWNEFSDIDTIMLGLGYSYGQLVQANVLDEEFSWQILKTQNLACEQKLKTGQDNYKKKINPFTDIIAEHTIFEHHPFSWWDVANVMADIKAKIFNSSLRRELGNDNTRKNIMSEDERSTQNMVYTLRQQTSRDVLAFYEKLSKDDTQANPSLVHIENNQLLKHLFKHCFTQPFNYVDNIQINNENGQLVLNAEALKIYKNSDTIELSYVRDKLVGCISIFGKGQINLSLDAILNAIYLDNGFWFLKDIGCIKITGWELNTKNKPAKFYFLCGKKAFFATSINPNYQISEHSVFDIYCNGKPYKFGSPSLENAISYLDNLCKTANNKNLFTIRDRKDHNLVYFNTYGMNQNIRHSL